MKYIVFIFGMAVFLTASVTRKPEKSIRSRNYLDNGRTCNLPHRVLPRQTRYTELVDSSGNAYTAWTNIQSCLAYDPNLNALQFVCRNYDPTGHLNVHQNGYFFWVHDMQVYQAEYGNARYPTSVASAGGPHIGFPVLDPGTGTWGHMGAQWCEGGWYSSLWASPVDLSGDIGSPRSIGVELPTGDIVYVCDEINGLLPYYTMSADLQTTVSSGNLASNSQIWGIDCNGGICYVFWYDLTDLSVWYVSTADGITWTPATEWELTYPAPYASNVLNWPQMAVTDAGNPILVFDLYDGNDLTYPYSSKIYVSNASGATPVEVSDISFDVSSYPTIATGDGYIAVVMQVAMDTTMLDSLARHDVFASFSSDGGANWSFPVNLTWDVTERPGLPQCAKRRGPPHPMIPVYFFYGVNLVEDHDPYWHVIGDPEGLDPHAWYVTPIMDAVEEHEGNTVVQSIKLEMYPNPFRTTTDISYEITTGCSIRLLIYDICGQLVKNLSQQQSTASHRLSVTWDGTDNHGNRLPAGVYFVRIHSSKGEQSVPVVLLR